MSKPKSTAKLLNLPEEQEARLADWLLGGMAYHEAQVLVLKEFGVEVKSLAPFSEFWDQVCAPHLLARRKQLSKTADARATAAEMDGDRFDAATMDAIRQKAYELAESPNAKPGEVKALMMLLLKARDQDLVNRRVKLLEAKAAQADEANQVSASQLTPEEKDRRMKAIFGIPA